MDTLTPLLETFGIKLEPRDSEEAYGKASRIATKDPSEPSTPSLFGMLELFSSSTSPLESRTASSDDDEAGKLVEIVFCHFMFVSISHIF